MDDTKNNSPEHKRTWASLGGFYEPDGPPVVKILEDPKGVQVRVQPFGHIGPDLCMPIDRWRKVSAAVEQAITAATSLKLRVL